MIKSFFPVTNWQTNANNNGKACVFLNVTAALFFHKMAVCPQRNILIVDQISISEDVVEA